MAHRLVVNRLAAIGVADRGQQIAQGQTLAHLCAGHAEGGGDGVDGAALLDQPHEGFVFAHGIGIAARDILQQRGFDGVCIVALFHDGAGRRGHLAQFLLDLLQREPAPPSGHDAIFAVLFAHQQGLAHPLGADAGEDVGDIGRRIAIAHVGLADFQLAELDVLKFHDVLLLA